jgi:hypothetical protein
LKLALLIGLLSAAASGPAGAADPTFALFRTLCLDSNGDTAAALASAEGKGWKPIPEKFMAGFPIRSAGGPPPIVHGRVDGDMSSPKSIRGALIVGHVPKFDTGGPPGGPIRDSSPNENTLGADLCVVAAPGADMSGLKADLASYARVPQSREVFQGPRSTAFAWRDGPEGRREVRASEMEGPTALGAKVLVADGDSAFVLVGLFTATK